MSKIKSLSTGEIAKHCGVNLRTVIRWINKGHLKGYKLPGRGNNRVLAADFIGFLESHDMPIPEELGSSQKRILVIDDDRSMASALNRLLRKNGFAVELAYDGLEAGIKISEFGPSLLILDLMMPNMNGYDVLTFLKNSKFNPIPVIVLSGAGDKAMKKAKKLGADACFEKPFDNMKLIANVKRLLGVD